jgi:predicted nucleotidyltransferase
MSAAPTHSVARARGAAEEAAALLARDPRIRLVYLFGSSLDPERAQVGDVDLAILAVPALDLVERLRLRADLVAATGIPIDLVALEEASIALAFEVVDGGACLFSRSPEDETRFALRARMRFFDFKPYIEEQWRAAGERAEERLRGPAT